MSTRPILTKTLEDVAFDREAGRPEAPWIQPEPPRDPGARILEELVPMIATILIAAILSALVVVYISGYASITRQGYTQMELREELRRERLKVAMARADVERLRQQERIVQQAVQKYQMVPLRQVQQVPLPPSLLGSEPASKRAGTSRSFSAKRAAGPGSRSLSLKERWRLSLPF